MEEESSSKSDDKPFSVIARFRQLKKEQEQPTSSEEKATSSNSAETTFQASTSGGGQGRFHGKRSFNESFGDRPSKRIAGDMDKGQKEVDCGITEFLREGPGFNAIIKNRYTDFQVNEIDYEGNVVRLTSTELVLPAVEKSETLTQEDDPSVMPPEKWDALRNIVDNKLSSSVDIDVTDLKKGERQRIHKAVKRRFGIHAFSNTNDIDGRKIMQISYATDKANAREARWPRERPEFLHFVLFKENSDMTDAINALAKFTCVKPNKFSYAGCKDKRAATSQWVCMQRGVVEKFKYCYKLRAIAVGNFCYKWKRLRLGDLKGNRFRLVLRNVKESDEIIKEAVEQLKENGFINYFGLQRFGNSSLVPTYAIGKAILSGDWKLAVELILKPRPGEASFRDLVEAREIWWESRNATDALKALSRKDRSIEGKILLGLRKHGPNAYQNAFDNLPRQIVTMYLHSYQSLIWNQIVSRRVKQFGLKVLPGDLVKVSLEDAADIANDGLAESDNDEEPNYQITEYGEGRIRVRVLSEQEATEASIFDVLYPLPGDDIRLPANEVAEWYIELLQADGYSMSTFGNVHKKYGMYGSYRFMLERPGDVNWYTLRYSDPDQDLLQTELAVLRKQPPLNLDTEGPLKALVLEFNLSVCCYATMAVRELTKCDTSVSNQASLSVQAKEESKQVQTDTHVNGNCEPQQETDEQGEMIKREAEADNIINKYLESNYH